MVARPGKALETVECINGGDNQGGQMGEVLVETTTQERSRSVGCVGGDLCIWHPPQPCIFNQVCNIKDFPVSNLQRQ